MTPVTYQGAWYAAAGYLAHLGVPAVFGLPGDDLAPAEALAGTPVRGLWCRDQRNAVFMATGYALASGRPGVCAIGKGPALTNALTGLLEARAGSAPLVLLAAGTAGDRRGSGAFQELDQLALAAPLAKWAHRAEAPARVVPALERALAVAVSGAPGPVYLELPDDLAAAPVTRERPWSGLPEALGGGGAAAGVEHLLASRRPVLLAGGGMRHRNDGGLLERLAEQLGAALFVTASGRGAVDEDHPLFCGLSGLYAPAATAELWRDADLVVALGSRLEETATLGWPRLPVLQVNVDAAELSAEHAGPRVVGDGAAAVAGWLAAFGARPPSPDPGWVEAVRGCHAALHSAAEAERKRLGDAERVHVAEVLAALDRLTAPDRVLVQENGLQDMWSYAYPFWSCGDRGGSVVPSEQTSLGFGAAAAAGVRVAAPERQVVALAGDGAMELFGADLGTVARERLAVLYVVLRNGGYGWLQRRLDRSGRSAGGARFAAPEACPPRRPDLHRAVVTRKRRLEPVLAGALAACAAGSPAVVDVAVGLDDVPPGLDALEGPA